MSDARSVGYRKIQGALEPAAPAYPTHLTDLGIFGGPHPGTRRKKKEFDDPGTRAILILDPHMAQAGGLHLG